MNILINFFTSKEVITICAVAGVACILCLIIYIVEKNNEKMKRRHNTRELNKLVNEIKEQTEIVEDEVIYETPIITPIEEEQVINTMLQEVSQQPTTVVEKQPVEQVVQTQQVTVIPEEIKESLIVIEENNQVVENITPVVQQEVVETIEEKQEELQYTSIEPDQETAKLELQKITETLKKQEEAKQEIENIALTNYEELQEENAIISLDELVRKGKELYESNESTQYADEGNEPISLAELEKNNLFKKEKEYTEPFVIADVVPQEQLAPIEEVIEPQTKEKKFKSSPIISPIYGIESAKENSMTANELALENTANYDKLDQEIKKTNEFIMSLKELQNNLD